MSEARPALPVSVAAVPPPARLVLFDGVCRFCDRAVRWLLRADPEGRFRFAPLQGETAAALRARHPEIPDALETLVYVESRGGEERVFLRSDAVFRVCRELGGVWRAVAWLRWLPRAFTDPAYALFVRHRYRVFGRFESCAVPGAHERARFLP